jgi:hypothetical protein
MNLDWIDAIIFGLLFLCSVSLVVVRLGREAEAEAVHNAEQIQKGPIDKKPGKRRSVFSSPARATPALL